MILFKIWNFEKKIYMQQNVIIFWSNKEMLKIKNIYYLKKVKYKMTNNRNQDFFLDLKYIKKFFIYIYFFIIK